MVAVSGPPTGRRPARRPRHESMSPAPAPDPHAAAELERLERLHQQDLAQRLHDGPL